MFDKSLRYLGPVRREAMKLTAVVNLVLLQAKKIFQLQKVLNMVYLRFVRGLSMALELHDAYLNVLSRLM